MPMKIIIAKVTGFIVKKEVKSTNTIDAISKIDVQSPIIYENC
jgi:hypothetical protein